MWSQKLFLCMFTQILSHTSIDVVTEIVSMYVYPDLVPHINFRCGQADESIRHGGSSCCVIGVEGNVPVVSFVARETSAITAAYPPSNIGCVETGGANVCALRRRSATIV